GVTDLAGPFHAAGIAVSDPATVRIEQCAGLTVGPPYRGCSFLITVLAEVDRLLCTGLVQPTLTSSSARAVQFGITWAGGPISNAGLAGVRPFREAREVDAMVRLHRVSKHQVASCIVFVADGDVVVGTGCVDGDRPAFPR